MKRSVFYSFHYKPDNWRVSQIRNIGIVEKNSLLSTNDWEQVKRQGDKAIKNWIDTQLQGRSCTIVLIGEKTAERKWVKYEIEKSWNLGKGVLGIYIHKLQDFNGNQSKQGKNPFEDLTVERKKLSSIVKAYNLPYITSTYVYSHIQENISNWVEEAITIRNNQ